MNKIIPFKEIEHTADVGIQIFGQNIEDLFKNAHQGFYALSLGGLNNFQQILRFSSHSNKSHSLRLQECTLEDLLIAFLSELNFNLQVKKLILAPLKKLTIDQQKQTPILLLESGHLNLNKQFQRKIEEIKAVTYHDLKIEKTNGLFTVTVIFDI